jgi:hypothetical protein
MSQGNNKEGKIENLISTTEKTNVGLEINEKTIKVKFTLDKGKVVNELNNSMFIEGLEKKDDKDENSIVAKLNASRAALGLKKLNFIFCNICKKKNDHFTSFCPNTTCNICFGNHPTFTCIRRYKCIYCNSLEHLSKFCTTEKAMNARAKKMVKCFRCGRMGHVAKNCKIKYNYSYGNYNYKYKSKRNKNYKK